MSKTKRIKVETVTFPLTPKGEIEAKEFAKKLNTNIRTTKIGYKVLVPKGTPNTPKKMIPRQKRSIIAAQV